MPNIHTLKAFDYPETLPKELGFPPPPRFAPSGWRPPGKSSPTTQQPRRPKKTSAAAADNDEPDLTTRRREFQLPCVEATVSSSEFGKGRLEGGRFVDWTTQRHTATVLLKLESKSILSRLVIRNRGTSLLSVRLGLTSKKAHQFITVMDSRPMPHNRVVELALGHLPCRYVQLVCASKSVGSHGAAAGGMGGAYGKKRPSALRFGGVGVGGGRGEMGDEQAGVSSLTHGLMDGL